MADRNSVHRMVQRLQVYPAGLWLFSRLVCMKAPYFRSIRPTFIFLEPGHAIARVRKRRAVTNHLGTVHAIAMANLCEFVAGTLMEVSISPTMRWIPKGMDIRYLAKADSDVTATCRIDDFDWKNTGDVQLSVGVQDADGRIVASATIPMYVSPKPR